MSGERELDAVAVRGRRFPHIEIPDWYFDFDGSVVIRTPYATSVVHKNGPGKFPFTPSFPGRHYDALPNAKLTWDIHNDGLAPDEISFKRFGEGAEVYRVVER